MTESEDVESATLRVRVPAGSDELAPLRSTLRTWLQGAGAGDDIVHDVTLAVSEACANAIEHPVGRRDLFIDVRAVVVGSEIQFLVRDSGAWREPSSAGRRGWGLVLIGAVVDEVTIERAAAGTEVRMTRRLSPATAGVPVG